MAIKPEATIYTDGACANNPGPGGWAAIVIVEGKEQEFFGGDESTTNNRMELLGVINGLKALRGPHIVNVISDSKYITDAFNKGWVANWKKNGWMTSGGTPVKNQDLWEKLIKLVETHSCTFTWVKGHAGNEYNEKVDKLAVAERDRQSAGKGTVEEEVCEATSESDSAEPEEQGASEGEFDVFTDITGSGTEGEEENEHAIYCLEMLLQSINEKEFSIKQPCGAHPWCECCGESRGFECAFSYMAYVKQQEAQNAEQTA